MEGAATAHGLQQSIFGFAALREHRFPAPWPGYGVENPEKKVLVGADFGETFGVRHWRSGPDGLLVQEPAALPGSLS